MFTRNLTKLFLVAILLLSASFVSAQDAEEIMKKSHMAYFYAANDGVAEVQMSIVNNKGKERNREFTMIRMDIEDGGNQKYFTYFKKPSDVSRTTFMVHKTADGNDLRWIYVPSIDLIKPISADDKNSSFVGSDFSYEDVSGRHWSEDTHTFKAEETINGKAVYVIVSVPKVEYKGFAKKVSYIDKENMLPLKEEYFDKKDELIREFTAEKIEDHGGVPTITVRKMTDVKKGGYTTVTFSEITYDVGIKEDIFTERYLKTPPREYISK